MQHRTPTLPLAPRSPSPFPKVRQLCNDLAVVVGALRLSTSLSLLNDGGPPHQALVRRKHDWAPWPILGGVAEAQAAEGEPSNRSSSGGPSEDPDSRSGSRSNSVTSLAAGSTPTASASNSLTSTPRMLRPPPSPVAEDQRW